MKKAIIFSLLLAQLGFSQNIKIPAYYELNATLSNELQKMVVELGLDGDFDAGEDGLEQISLAVIDLTKDTPQLGGVNMDNFIYPASVYK
ncbi:hypothetical protein GF337_15160, partial [candidate division KSB1 bacterium]|nr:hypothetical protein [candidate division KSB1 bacterium]